MSLFETAPYDSLLAEQERDQAEKFQGRLLDEYNSLIFPDQNWAESERRGSAIVDFIKPLTGDDGSATLEAVLQGLGETKPGQQVHWVDMGGGRALPMRQLGSMPGIDPGLQMINVDLFNVGLEGLKPSKLEYFEDLTPGMIKSEAGPTLIIDDI